MRVNADDKEAAEAIYADMGTSLSEAVRMFIHESIKLNTLPFRPVSGLTKGKMQAARALHIYADKKMCEAEREAWVKSLSKKYEDANRRNLPAALCVAG